MAAKPNLERLGESGLADHGGRWIPAENALEVYTPHALNQAVGYIKYFHGTDGVYFRGQTKTHATMRASLFRMVRSWTMVHKRVEALNILIKQARVKETFIASTPTYAHEPLLQHYGIRTRWLDLVDNVWVALWFGCYEAKATGNYNQYLHYIRRREGYAYIVLINVGTEEPDSTKPGITRSGTAEIIDLRRAAPSLYLRPHAQHGLLFRPLEITKLADVDLSAHVAGLIRVLTGGQ